MSWPRPLPLRRRCYARPTPRTSLLSPSKPWVFEVLTPDQLLSLLVSEHPPQMLAVHRTAVASLKGATDESTIAALTKAGAARTAILIDDLLRCWTE